MTIIVLMVMLLASITVFPASAATVKTLVDTQKFCDAVRQRMIDEGIWSENSDKLTPERIRKKSNFEFYKETEDIVVFRIAGQGDMMAEDIIGDYKFVADSWFGKDDSNRCGNFVYTNSKLYTLKSAVDKGFVHIVEMAEIIPNTEYIGKGTRPVWRDLAQDYSDNTVLVMLTDKAASQVKNGEFSFNVDYFKDSGLGIVGVEDLTKWTGQCKSFCLELDIHNHQNVLNVIEALNKYDIVEIAEVNGCCYIPESVFVTQSDLKKANPMKVTVKTKTVKYKKLKKVKQTVAPITVKKAQGKVSYKKLSGAKKLTLKSNGKVVVKKGAKKGTYTAKIKVTAKGNSKYKSASKTVKLKIKVI